MATKSLVKRSGTRRVDNSYGIILATVTESDGLSVLVTVDSVMHATLNWSRVENPFWATKSRNCESEHEAPPQNSIESGCGSDVVELR